MALTPKSVSVVIPARNRSTEITECLSGLKASASTPLEVIVVDDGSTDGTAETASQWGADVVRLDGHFDANYCRNAGAAKAKGDLLLFLDSDVIPTPGLVDNVVRVMEEEDVDAAVGIYSERHRNSGIISQYKNLWIRYSYLASRRVEWVFGAVTAIRRSTFQDLGGFDGSLRMHHGAEDFELGTRMRRHRIVLSTDLEVEHLKRHSLGTLLANDFMRSQGIFNLAARSGSILTSLWRGYMNIYPAFIHSTIIIPALVASMVFAFFHEAFLWVIPVLTTIYLVINFDFLRFFFKRHTLGATVRILGVMILDHAVCALGATTALYKRTVTG